MTLAHVDLVKNINNVMVKLTNQKMKHSEIIDLLLLKYKDMVVKKVYAEESLFYNPNNLLPNGKYFCTFKFNDGPNDKSSFLSRNSDTFRFNFKISKESFLKYFKELDLPKRPIKGCTIELASGSDINFHNENVLLPHPTYAWMSWVCIINPTKLMLESICDSGFLDESYSHAYKLFNKKSGCKKVH